MTTSEQVSASTATQPPAFPFKRTSPFSNPVEYDQGGPVRDILFKGVPAKLVTDYSAVRAVLADRASSVRDIPDPSRGDDGSEALPGFFIAMDPPDHTRLRKLLAREFTPRRMEELRPAVERITDKLVDDIIAKHDKGEPVDLVDMLALPLPSLVICELLGVPYDKHDWFQEETRKVLDPRNGVEAINGAIAAVMQYLAELTQEKYDNPGDDLISLLINHVRSGELTIQEVAGLSTFLLMAGHETTGNMISLAILTLLTHPDQLQLIKDDPSLTPGAVEELLRYLDIIGNLPRRLTDDVEVDGHTFAKGDLVVVSMERANRDSDVFANPHVLDIRRDARGHVAFGYGIHVCMGAPLARIELQTVISKVFGRIPDLQLAVPFEEIPLKNDAKIFGLYSLPVTW